MINYDSSSSVLRDLKRERKVKRSEEEEKRQKDEIRGALRKL